MLVVVFVLQHSFSTVECFFFTERSERDLIKFK